MNREDLIKKLELARVGNGTQTYNDVVVTLTKEETLELLKNNERLEKELKQTKLNFKNSQTHSKNCYKKLKEKYEKYFDALENVCISPGDKRVMYAKDDADVSIELRCKHYEKHNPIGIR